MQKKPKTFWFLFIGGVVIVAAFFLTAPDQPKASIKKPTNRAYASRTADEYTAEDRAARFVTVAAPLKDAFKPLVVRKDSGGGAQSNLANAIPSEYTEGEGNWAYTGTAEIDGVPQALFENKTTQEGIFVRQGEHWKRAVIEQIMPTTVLISGPGGEHRLELVNEQPVVAAAPAAANPAGVQPVSPQISGPIGNPNPADANAATGQPDFGAGGGGRRRRGFGG
jgi:hypothetical protein